MALRRFNGRVEMINLPNFRTLKMGKQSKTGVVVFTMMRDERYFLPFFLDHYRSLGAAEFCIYADRCSDEFLDALTSQSDVSVLTSDAAYGDDFGLQASGKVRRLVQYLKESLVDHMFAGRWVLTVDADEFLILPPPEVRLSQFADRLDAAGQLYCFAPMVDFYPQFLAHRNHELAMSPFEVSKFFDKGPYFQFDEESGKVRPLYGGVRHRLLMFLKRHYPSELQRIFGDHPQIPALNYKFPLLKHGAGVKRQGCHRIDSLVSIGVSAALAHFKFYPELDDKVATALGEAQYYNSSMEYRYLKFALQKMAHANLLCERSVRYTGPESLVQGGLFSGALHQKHI